MIFKLNYSSRINNEKTFNAIVSYEGKKYYNKSMLKVIFIGSCSEPYLENVKIGDYFICTENFDESKSFMNLKLYEWESSIDKKHYNFDIYHNCDNDKTNAFLTRLKDDN